MEFFVVDVWKKDGETWKLVNRFVSKGKLCSLHAQNRRAANMGKQ